MTNIGFIGLGSMGRAMAQRLIDAGHHVTAWNRSDGPAATLAEAGGVAATSLSQALSKPVIISMLANDAAADAVFAPEGLTDAPEGAVHLNMASLSVAMSKVLAERHAAAGITYIAAPVLGRPPVAAAGKLTIVAGGPQAAIDDLRPLLDVLGQRVWHVSDDPTSANLVKIGVNYTIIHALQAMSESVALIEHGGIDPSTFIDILNSSLFPGPVYDGYGHMIAERRYAPPGFTVTLGRKDLGLAQDAAAEYGANLATAPALVDVFEAALADPELRDLDWAAIAEITRQRSV